MSRALCSGTDQGWRCSPCYQRSSRPHHSYCPQNRVAWPLVLLLWAAVIVPSMMRRGTSRVAIRLWRLAATAFVALPTLLTVSSAATGTTGLDWIGVALWVVGPLVLAVLCACGFRAGYAVTALAGALVMIFAMVEPGFLFTAFWLLGGLYLTIGASGVVTVTRGRATENPAPMS